MSPEIARIALTPGEPAGIGPDLCAELAWQEHDAQLIAFADPELLQQRAKQLGRALYLLPFDANAAPSRCPPGTLYHVPIALRAPAACGHLDTANAAYVLDTLEQACRACQLRQCDALVTGPVHKGVINDAGIAFSGHTEFLAQQCGVDDVVMMLAAPGLRVALVTTHIPLREVSAAITPARLRHVMQVLADELRNSFGIERPRLLVCGLNPHAGEGGHLGREELDIIEPTLESLRADGLQIVGPLPADTLFIAKYLDQCDAVVAMYHDQGLPVLKHMGFGRAVNITLGLPIIRTSVDHGTALELAGVGGVDSGSMNTALATALAMVRARAAAGKLV